MEANPQDLPAAKLPLIAGQNPQTVGDGPSEGQAAPQAVAEESGTVADWKRDAAFLRNVAEGREPFSTTKGNHNVKLSDYGHAAASHLGHVLGMNRKEVITLALCHYGRALTNAPIVTQQDLATLTKGMQFVVQELTLEVAEFSQLALAVADQEAVAGPAVKL